MLIWEKNGNKSRMLPTCLTNPSKGRRSVLTGANSASAVYEIICVSLALPSPDLKSVSEANNSAP